MQDKIGQTLPQFDLASIRRCLLAFVDVLERESQVLTAGTLPLRGADRRLLARVRQNQSHQ